MPKRAIYYDTETTGLRPAQDKIIELAAYDPERNATFCEFINPQIPIPEESSRLTGITDQMVEKASSFAEVGARFLSFCEGDVVLIAHNNNAFDRPFLESEFARAEIHFPLFSYIDTLLFARKYRPDLPRHTLQFLREAYGIPANQAHRALDDVKVLSTLFSIMVDDLTWEQVIALLKEEKKGSRMPFGKHAGKPLNEVPKDYVRWLKESGFFDKRENENLKKSFQEIGAI